MIGRMRLQDCSCSPPSNPLPSLKSGTFLHQSQKLRGEGDPYISLLGKAEGARERTGSVGRLCHTNPSRTPETELQEEEIGIRKDRLISIPEPPHLTAYTQESFLPLCHSSMQVIGCNSTPCSLSGAHTPGSSLSL